METYYPIIKKCALFRGIEENNYKHLLGCLNVQIKHFKENEYLFFAGDRINKVGVVLSGSVEILKENLAGNKHIIAILESSHLFAEGIVCTANRISPVTVQAKESTMVMFIPYEKIIRSCGQS